MVIETVQLKNYRNYAAQKVDFFPGINLITGSNAQGKTNLLESVFVACVGKSPRSKDKELILSGKERAFIKMVSRRYEGGVTTEMILSKSENKRILINGACLLRTGELLGVTGAVYFYPDDLKLIKDAPESRRRFLDMDLSQVYKSYYYSLTRYNKALLSRNNLLKKYSPSSLPDMLYPYDLQLAKEGSLIAKQRRDYLELLKGEANKVHRFLTSNEENLEIGYSTAVNFSENTEELYEKKLKDNLEKDMQLKYTSFGVHRDDIKLVVNGLDIRIYGSQGQQRTAALSLKLAELELFKDICGEYPILLLDDVLSELDKSRQRKLLELCAKVQSILTATHIEPDLLVDLPCKVFTVKQGQVFEG